MAKGFVVPHRYQLSVLAAIWTPWRSTTRRRTPGACRRRCSPSGGPTRACASSTSPRHERTKIGDLTKIIFSSNDSFRSSEKCLILFWVFQKFKNELESKNLSLVNLWRPVIVKTLRDEEKIFLFLIMKSTEFDEKTQKKTTLKHLTLFRSRT